MYALNDNYYQNQFDKKIYNAALYLRLSREDEGNGQSESINNQRDYLTKYVLERNWNLFGIYIDDGFTGTNFNRPDFKRMIADVESKKINLVITKDLSRLGRDYIETGYYIERYFPEHNVRYIALNDGIDTFANNTNNDMSPFKSVINDLYAKDISKKVRTAFRTKVERGEFIGAYAPYGYRKSLNNKNAFIIDEDVAPIIKRIFEMYIEGMGYVQIAKTLNREGIKSPAQYKKEISPNYNHYLAKYGLWTAETIRSILMNQVYIGNMVQHKSEKISYKVKKFHLIDHESHIIVENTHAPIISVDTFSLVQQIIQSKPVYKQVKNDKPHLLSGLLYCGLCGHRMTFCKNSRGTSYVICSKYKRFTECQRNGINEKKLDEEIVSRLKTMAKKVLNKSKVINSIEIKKDNSQKNTTESQVNTINNRLAEIQRVLKALYEDKIRGLLSEKDFLNFMNEFNQEREHLSSKLSILEREQRKAEKIKEVDTVSEIIKGIIDFEIVPKNMLVQLIDRIEINGTDNISIKYKFKNPN
ncbi:MAG: recombinase family protein [Bacillota bacterium]|nr:recombinase family protein [Bacillota bacterium]